MSSSSQAGDRQPRRPLFPMLVRLLALAATAVVSLGPAVSAIPLEGSVVFNEHLPGEQVETHHLLPAYRTASSSLTVPPAVADDADISAVRPSTSVSLDHGAKLAYVLKDGSFSL